MNIENFLSRLNNPRSSGQNSWMAHCPAHDDRTPSLSVSVGDDDRILVHCHAGCATADVLDVLDLTMMDLFPDNDNYRIPTSKKPQRQLEKDEFFGTFEDFHKNPYLDLPGLVDWEELFTGPPYEQEWLAPFLIPKGKLITLFGEAKLGKSLLALEAAAAVASGRPFLGQPTIKTNVLYLDFENHPRSDIRPRLEAMGYIWEELKDCLFFLSFPQISDLNTATGGQRLYEMVTNHNIGLVVVDTIVRIIEGKENDNDTWNDLEKFAERLLKRDGVTFVRIDHPGKDVDKGPRGGSAKTGDVDLTWLLSAARDGKLRLKSIGHRFPLEHSDLILERLTTPVLRHELVTSNRKPTPSERLKFLISILDARNESSELTVEQTGEILRNLGQTVSRELVAEVARTRKEQAGIVTKNKKNTKMYPRSVEDGTWGWGLHSVPTPRRYGTRNNIVGIRIHTGKSCSASLRSTGIGNR